MKVVCANDMLLKIDREAHEVQKRVIKTFVNDSVGQRIIERMLRNPTTRPLMELELNGCTSFQSARVLVAESFVQPKTFRARAQGFRGKVCEYLEPTSLGMAALFDEHEGLEDNQWVALLRGAIIGYSCVDYGSGICATRDRLETALELPDPELLHRCVHFASGEKQFPEAQSLGTLINDNQRAEASYWWSSVEAEKRSGQVLDFSSMREDGI